ncbi:MAG: hypothetical protein ACRDRI_26715, partial [Pseudonocardiaceae bacterium]
REISSRSASVTSLRSQLTRCSSSTVSPTIYTKINCYDRLGSSIGSRNGWYSMIELLGGGVRDPQGGYVVVWDRA